jgi:hypothetical protein
MVNKSKKRTEFKKRTLKRNKNGGAGVFDAIGRINPRTIDTYLAKIDAMLIHLKVPWLFSDGTLASNYNISPDNPATRENGGRGNQQRPQPKGNTSSFFSSWSRSPTPRSMPAPIPRPNENSL